MPAESFGSPVEIAARDGPANRCRGDMLPVAQGDGFHNIDFETAREAKLPQNSNIPRSPMSETMIISDEKLSHPETPPQYLVDEFFCAI